jgi:hypothetical protein
MDLSVAIMAPAALPGTDTTPIIIKHASCSGLADQHFIFNPCMVRDDQRRGDFLL